jgi:hypothetical protein
MLNTLKEEQEEQLEQQLEREKRVATVLSR